MATSGEVTPNDGFTIGIPPKMHLYLNHSGVGLVVIQDFFDSSLSKVDPKDRAKKAAAAGLPPSAAAAAAAATLEREALPAEVQVTVAVLGHQGLVTWSCWWNGIISYIPMPQLKICVYIGMVWPVFLGLR